MSYTEAEIEGLIEYLTPQEKQQLATLMNTPTLPWEPLEGPQTLAYESKADIIGFGGAAGGGKTDLACGKAITRHQKVMILRKIGTELSGVVDRLTELMGSRDGYNGQDKIWRTLRYDGVPLQIELGAVPNLDDEKKYQGRPHDLLVFDEAANFLEIQVRFLLGWLRSVDPNQICQALFTFNPPTSINGRWIIPFFGPWIDKDFKGKKSAPGEIRYAAMIPTENGTSKDLWVDSPEPFVLVEGQRVYDFDPEDFSKTEIIKPLGRTFIPSKVTDNPFYMNTGYVSVLQAMPEPLRSQMLNGDFSAGIEDDPWQVIPTAWVEAAMARWKPDGKKGVMDSVGVDVARGGKDNTEIARRHGTWFDKPVSHPGDQTPDGPKTAGLVVAEVRDRARIHIDVIGVGSSPYDHLVGLEMDVIGVNVAEAPTAKSKQGNLTFFNLRSQLWWQMREALDPQNRTPIALPPDDTLKAELCTPKWEMRGIKVYVQSREDIIKEIGRSPDRATAYIQALMDTPMSPSHVIHSESEQQLAEERTEYSPYD